MINQKPFWPGHKRSELKDKDGNGEKTQAIKKSISFKIIVLFILLLIIGIIVLYFIFRS